MENTPENNQETVVAQWEQPARVGITAGGTGRLWLMAVPAALILTGLAFWQREVNFGLAAAVVLVAVLALQLQNRNSSLVIAVTNLRIVVGRREYPLADLAGFWLNDEGDVVEVNLENKKPGLLPMSFLYATPSPDEARGTLGQVLPELEPRQSRLGGRFSRLFRL